MRESLGIIEIVGLTTAVFVADTMVKTANVDIIDIENTKGLGYMTVKITGNVAAVNTAVSAGKMIAESHGKFVSATVIARPAESIDGLFVEPSKKKEKEIKEEVKEEVKETKEEEIEEIKEKVEEQVQEVKEEKKEIKEEEKKIEKVEIKEKEKIEKKVPKKKITKKSKK